jgi:hypothetical protein
MGAEARETVGKDGERERPRLKCRDPLDDPPHVPENPEDLLWPAWKTSTPY